MTIVTTSLYLFISVVTAKPEPKEDPCMHINKQFTTPTDEHTQTQTWTHKYTPVRTHTHTHTHTHTNKQTHIHTNTYTHTQILDL
jgi:carbohydrate-binding DOMON domain-containing protein